MYMRFHAVDHIVDIYVKNLLYILCIYIYRYITFLTYTFTIGCTSIYIVCGVLPQSRRCFPFGTGNRYTGTRHSGDVAHRPLEYSFSETCGQQSFLEGRWRQGSSCCIPQRLLQVAGHRHPATFPGIFVSL